MPHTPRAPAIFLGHGSPMVAIEPNDAARTWGPLAQRFERPKLILAISAHWETKGVLITAAERPRTIHDFYNFPQALYDMDYPAPGDPAFAKALEARLAPFNARADLDGWGLDHGTWSVLHYMYPDADIPVVQLSMDLRRTPAGHYQIGQALEALRDEGVLILGSGMIVHNFSFFRNRDPVAMGKAHAFAKHVAERVEARDHQPLVNYLSFGEGAALSVPEPEHYLPLLYVLAATRPEESVEIFNQDSMVGGMTSVAIGLN